MNARRALGVVIPFIVAAAVPVAVHAATVVVTMTTGDTFQPRSVIINAGDTVRWENPAGGAPHTVVADNGSFTSPTINGGESFSLVFGTAGTVHYHCGLHGGPGGVGMSGSLFVGNRVQHAANEEILQINAWEMTPLNHLTGWRMAADGYRYADPGGNFLAPVNLPTGSEITGLELVACDSDSTADFYALFAKCTESGPCTYPTEASTAGTPGCGFFANSTPINEIVDNVGASYHINLSAELIGTVPDALRFRVIRVYYRRAISYPPATATFADVPASHPFYRFIEALVAAGITGGCASPPAQYCPDAPLTRGQMAVFLTRALGLHWAN